jgi:hypothetical protein
MNKTAGPWQIIMKGTFSGSLFDFDLNFNSTLTGWGAGTASGQQGGTDFLVFQDGSRSHTGSSASVIASSATWPSNLRVYMPNTEGFYLVVKRNSDGKITIQFFMYDGTLLYQVVTLSTISMTNASYFHMYVNSGSFKWYKGALVDPAGTATIGDWDCAFDP